MTPAPGVLPTFLIVGAPKAGTTSLHEYLAAHPEVSMSSEKEPMIFEPPDWEERLGDYARLLDGGAPVRGESSTAYSGFPWVPEIPDRVRSVAPDMRIVYLVRDPVPRTLSHYVQNVADRKPVRPFDELMDDLEHPLNMPVWASRYATQYERWAERFEHVLVIDQHDLLHDRDATVARVLEFIGADPAFRSADWEVEHNTAGDHRLPTALGRRFPRAARGRLRPLLTRPVPKPDLTPAQRERLVGLLRPEAERLAALTGVSVARWSL